MSTRNYVEQSDIIPYSEDLTDQSTQYFKHNIELKESFPILGNGFGTLLHDRFGNRMDQTSFTLNNNKVEVLFTTVNSSFKDENSLLLIFAGDRLQSFYIDNQTQPIFFFPYTLNKRSYLNIPLSFYPAIENEDTLIYFVQIMSLDHLPSETTNIDYFIHSHRSSIELLEDDPDKNLPPFAEHISPVSKRSGIKNFTLNDNLIMGFSSDGFEHNDFDGIGFANYDAFLSINSTDRTFDFEAFGAQGQYITIFFIDHEPIKWNGYSGIIWSIEEDEMISYSIKLDGTVDLGEHQLYSISFPISPQSFLQRPVSSQKYVLNIVP